MISDASVHSYNSSSARYFYFICACGFEWTERQKPLDRTVSVSSDEVIVVHALLAKFEGSMVELLTRRGE
jgi:hypothetical protein